MQAPFSRFGVPIEKGVMVIWEVVVFWFHKRARHVLPLRSGGGRSILFGVAKEDAPWCPGTTAHERGRGGRGPQAPVAPGTIRTGERRIDSPKTLLLTGTPTSH